MPDASTPTLALDLAARTGYAHSAGHHGVWPLTITGSEHDGNRLMRLYDRLHTAHETWVIKRIAAEDASFGSHNPSIQAMHNELRGIVKLVAAELRVPFVFYNPGTIKLFATGNGRATKSDMVRFCKLHFGIDPEDDNVADALFILKMALQGYEVKRSAKPKPVARSKRPKEPRLFR